MVIVFWGRSVVVITSPCHGEDRRFESGRPRHSTPRQLAGRSWSPTSERSESNALNEVEGLKNMKFFTYIILCGIDKYYVGHSSDVELRFKRHLKKKWSKVHCSKYTSQNSLETGIRNRN